MSDVYLFIISPSIFGLIIIYPSNLCLCVFILHVVIHVLTSTTLSVCTVVIIRAYLMELIIKDICVQWSKGLR